MSVLVFVESAEGEVKKSSQEAVAYAAAVAAKLGTSVTALAFGGSEAALADLGKFGATKVLNATDSRLENPNSVAAATAISQAVEAEGATVVIFAKSSLTDGAAPRVAARFKAGFVTNASEVPSTDGGKFTVKRSIYTGKAFANVELKGDKKIVSIKKNAVTVTEGSGSATVAAFAPTFADSDFLVKSKSVEKATGEILLPEAEIVVSGGRGLKGPENWFLVEDLAKVLGAATGCSKPVSDLDWRPHHEHVGQTGIKVSPNLYIAIGISGAIQHVAGINSSKVIVAINKDPEAPIFKAADYGIVGDAFEVIPKLTEAFKAAK
ncbi:electron transfer flavoprotein alpha subunit [Flexibacter flexilis DSM 6793]|uniref:Electron transfer flavoprotein alpha subunit n=1 Tax=Flexibacter flexilis DSM 6793 TaxID=927664 RepID=A0A1I1G6N2_9BACT|nr:electron transfer flavoprotein subunit alpha/FixB family protein [Flexibacter flexilis]SFC06972.1 electron transfer flavoprotein alpha subunit [Flexibacter flexilis DSM 6793]